MSQAARRNLTFTHCGASKPTNSCLKSRFVSAGHHSHALLKSRHPLIDDVILSSLARHATGGYWMHAAGGEGQLESKGYERLIQTIRLCLKGEQLRMIEQDCQGYQ